MAVKPINKACSTVLKAPKFKCEEKPKKGIKVPIKGTNQIIEI